MATLAHPEVFPNFFNDLRRPFAICSDIVVIVVSYYSAFAIRFDMAIPSEYLRVMLHTLPLVIVIRSATFWYFGLYRGLWRFASVIDLYQIIKSVSASSILLILVFYMTNQFEGYPRSIFLIDSLCLLVLVGGWRLFIPLVTEVARVKDPGGKRVLIVGAGAAGASILRQIIRNGSLNYKPVGLVDDDPKKMKSSIHGVKVLGDSSRIPEITKRLRVEEIIVTIPSASGSQMRRIVDVCKESGVAYRTLPGIADIIDGKASVNSLREVNVVDLIGRPPVQLDANGIREYLREKRVLVTGCGGSIGSELCRQIVRFRPAQIILMDSSEENLFKIHMQLKNELTFSAVLPVLGRVQNRPLTEQVFRRYTPEVVFHAAACKHVPMVEINPWEAVFNNIMASRVLTEMAVKYHVERCVLVSTDKAVQPSNVMGASKRVTELIVQALTGSGPRFMAVRFGNVIGSSGSVIPVFKHQIEYGGPVTVTHPDVTRYFMTIPEATQLILQAAALGKGGEIFVLDMGTPVKIADLAADLIRLSGKEPGKDIEITFTGLREGEKLHEKLVTEEENLASTSHEKILVLKQNGTIYNGFHTTGEFREWLDAKLEEVGQAAVAMEGLRIKRKLQEIVPEYSPRDTSSILRN
ncbi:MAG: UDP-N-acetyl-alpha-D-glucosamine C6 dehydratase [Syntrophorhabdaceae bacterium PtaU1.Bin034]|nr:MAG: UDP-N-acetyl-alpha-D-glucosamine C6 dehydratase [Syntrophorhabdaceae bacterium PtaU1.Bin034]